MTLTLSEEQSFLKDTAKKFAQEKTPTTHFREIRDNENPECFDRAIWQEMAAQGWSGILVPEEYGGSNFGLAGIGGCAGRTRKNFNALPSFCNFCSLRNNLKQSWERLTKKRIPK